MELWNLDRRQLLQRFEEFGIGEDRIYTLQFSPDGNTLAIGTENTLVLWDIHTNRARSVDRQRLVLTSAFSLDGKILATGGDGGVKFWSVETGQPLELVLPCSTVESLAFSPDGRQLAAGDVTGNISVWNTATGERLWSKRLAGRYRLVIPTAVPVAMFGVWVVAWLVVIKKRSFSSRSTSARRLAQVDF